METDNIIDTLTEQQQEMRRLKRLDHELNAELAALLHYPYHLGMDYEQLKADRAKFVEGAVWAFEQKK